MEITTMQMYWLVILDSINIGSVIICVILGGCTVGMICYITELYGEVPRSIKVCMPLVVFLFFTAFAISVFLPSSKQMAAIMIVPRIANSEKVQTVGNKVYDLAVEWMEELKPKKPNKKKAKGVTDEQ